MNDVAHHPSEAVLADYASGAMADGPSLTVAVHLERCPKCRADLRLLETLGGALIDGLQPVAMAPGALDLALARIERPAPRPAPARKVRPAPESLAWPAALARRGVGPRRFVAPGIWVAPVPSRCPGGWRTYLLRAPAGVTVPHHDHNGPEYTVLLRGAFVDDAERYAEGDFAEAGPGAAHHPKAEVDGPCICLISGQGGVKADGILKFIQPWLGV